MLVKGYATSTDSVKSKKKTKNLKAGNSLGNEFNMYLKIYEL